MSNDNSLRVIVDKPVRVEARIGVFEIRRFKVRQIEDIGSAIKNMQAKAEGGKITTANFLGLLADNVDDLLNIVSVAVGIDRDKLSEMDVEELYQIAEIIFEVNADFFRKRVAPLMVNVLAWLAEANQIGMRAFSDSLPLDTEKATS